MNNIFVIVPCFNEDNAVVRKTLENLTALDYSIVLVDDGSTKELDVNGFDIFKLKHQINLGQGAAIQTGIDFALQQGAEYFVTFDADGQYNASEIEGMINLLKTEEYDMVFGSRFLKGALTNIPNHRKIIIKSARFFNFILSGSLLTDAHNGLRAFNLNAAKKIRIKENKMAHASEFLIEVKRKKLKFVEYPASIQYSTYSLKKGQKASNSIKIIFDLIVAKIFE